MQDQISGSIRVLAAMTAGFLGTMALEWLEVDIAEYGPMLTAALQVLFNIIYYVIVRAVAKYIPFAEYFLVIPKSPVYVSPGDQVKASTFLKQNKM